MTAEPIRVKSAEPAFIRVLWNMKVSRNRLLNLQPESAWVGEVAVGESIQESKTGDSVQARGPYLDADGRDRLVEPKHGNTDLNQVDWVGPDISSAEYDPLQRDSSAQQAILLMQKEFEARLCSAGARVCQELTGHLLASMYQGKNHLDDGPIIEQRPLGTRHQRSPQISWTTS
jgi:hypothetical protein